MTRNLLVILILVETAKTATDLEIPTFGSNQDVMTTVESAKSQIVPNHKSGNKTKIEEFSKEFRIQPPVNINSIVMFKTNTPNSERSLEYDFDDAIEKGRNTSNASNAPENEFEKVIGNLI